MRTIVVTGSTDVWISGYELRCGEDSDYCPVSFHLEGGVWREAGKIAASTLAAAAPDDVWAVATAQPNGLDRGMWHWDGRAWARVDTTALLPFQLAAVGEGELWGAGGREISHRRAGAGH
jgi:hypothetical protein